ncbi:hypothetical protein RLOC_00001691 [Lonchura striata]|uniref:Uncharacterized protein n=1 Tax=Lonchura striata TaxID=40157 RepID=A0A218UL30_9PASE|nr:hypothetical protein RLOC_00001691 [Lonchura striata domestica]
MGWGEGPSPMCCFPELLLGCRAPRVTPRLCPARGRGGCACWRHRRVPPRWLSPGSLSAWLGAAATPAGGTRCPPSPGRRSAPGSSLAFRGRAAAAGGMAAGWQRSDSGDREIFASPRRLLPGGMAFVTGVMDAARPLS